MSLAVDENFNNDIIRGIRRRNAHIDIVRVQDEGLSNTDDSIILAWAAQTGRLFFTHDVATMTYYAYERVRAGKPMPGVFELSRNVPIRIAIEQMILIAECSFEGEWEGQVRYLPLK